MDTLKIDQAMAWVRQLKTKHHGELPEWNRYQELLKIHLADPFDPRSYRMPKEYYYAYLRCKGLSHDECLERMGLPLRRASVKKEKKSFWKFW